MGAQGRASLAPRVTVAAGMSCAISQPLEIMIHPFEQPFRD